MIEVKDVSIVKSGIRLIENFNWKIESGEHWVITGANGAGKTILLETLAGIAHAARGEVIYDFITGDTWDQRFAQRKALIHYIPTHAIQSFLRSHELYYQQRYYSVGEEGIPSVKEILGDHVERLHELNFPASFNIDSLLNLPVIGLSNGQLKKVLILKSLILELPKVLLLDYPFEGLDHRSRTDLIDFLDLLAKTFGVQLILADHDHHLPQVINRKLVLDNFQISSKENVTINSTQVVEMHSSVGDFKSSSALPVVEMKDLTIRYGEKEIISKLNWTIRKGERWALTGRNGSGKTTLFSLIFADHPMAYSEQVYLFGKRRGTGESIWDIKQRINYLGPELINYFNSKNERSTAKEYILTQNKADVLPQLESAIQFFDANSFINQPVHHLSSGELQLMLIISSLVSDKELLLLDEPFQFLDKVTKERVQHYIQSHLHVDTTLVLITHYEQDISRWTNHRLHI